MQLLMETKSTLTAPLP